MLIDWFTVGAQAINFLILVWLLKRFLYKPILHAIDAREKRIAAELADADAKKAEAQKERDEFQHKNEAFDQQRAALLSKATDEAESRTPAAPRRSAKGGRRVACQTPGGVAKRTHGNSSQEIIRRTQKEVFAIARKTLADLATTSLEERMGEVFIRRLREMDGAGESRPGRRPQDRVRPARSCAARSICRRSSARRYKMRSTKPSRLRSASGSRPRRNWSAASNSPPMDRRWPGASRITSRRWKRAPVNF